MTAVKTSQEAAMSQKARRSVLLRQLHLWHWMSAAVTLAALILFSVTGITLNHADIIPATPKTESRLFDLPDAALGELQRMAQSATKGQALPSAQQLMLEKAFGIDLAGRSTEWSSDEIYISMPRPGGDAWLNIDLSSGEAEYEVTSRGVVSYLNDLHKGRHTSQAWKWFIDVLAVLCLVFAVTGLLIMKLHAAQRPSTWPLVAAGLVLPILLLLLFVH